MGKIYINETIIEGRRMMLKNGKVFIDGDEFAVEGRDINIRIEGDMDSVKVDICSKIDVVGTVKDLNTTSADVEVKGDVTGDVQTTSGTVKVTGNISGKAQTVSGNIKAGAISGNCKTVSGDIKVK